MPSLDQIAAVLLAIVGTPIAVLAVWAFAFPERRR